MQTALITSLPQPPANPASGASTPVPAAVAPSASTAGPASATPDSPSTPPLKTKTHNIHSEILLALNPNNNISDALRAFSVSDKTRRLLVVRIASAVEDDEAALYGALAALVDGRLAGVDDVSRNTDWKRVDKLYKLAELNGALAKMEGDADARVAKKRAAVVNAVAVKPST